MNIVLKSVKKIFTVSVVGATMLWSVGAAPLLVNTANAAVCPTLSAGDMVKVSGKAAIYSVNKMNQILYFPSGDEFKSWNGLSATAANQYAGYTTITQACFDSLPVPSAYPGAVNFQPGSYILKRTSSDQLYAVLPGNSLAKISSADAAALYGSNYKVMTVADAFWPHYVNRGADVMGTVHEGMLVSKDGKTWYVAANKVLREVTETGMTANRFKSGWVHAVPASYLIGTTVGTQITALESVLANRTQDGAIVAQTGGTLNVSLAAENPASKTVPKGATNIDVLKFNAVNPSANDSILDELVIKRVGVGAVTGLTVTLYDGANRVGTGKTFASDTNEAVFSALNLTVKAGTTKALSLRLATTAGSVGDSAFSVISAKLASGNAGGSMPLVGNTFTIGSQTAGSVTVDDNGTLSAAVVGDSGASVAQFKLTAGSEDIDVYSFTLKQGGTIDTSHLSNFVVTQGTNSVPAVATVSGRLVAFTLNSPLRILNGANKIFTVKADVSALADSGDTVDFYMDSTNDVKAVGVSYGYGVSVTNNYASLEQDYTLLGGGVTIANKSLAAHDVKTDSTEVELGKVAITAKSDTVEIQKMTVTVNPDEVAASGGYDWGMFKTGVGQNYTGTSTLLLRNLKLKDLDTGRTVGSAKAVTDADGWAGTESEEDTLTFVYTEYFTIAKGATRNIALVADINSAQISGVVYTATFDFTDATKFVIKDSKDVAVTDIVPRSTIASNPITTRSSALTVSRATTPESRTVVKGSTVDALGMIFAAGSGTGNDVKLTALTLNVYVDNVGTTDGTYVDTTEGTVDANELVTEVNLYVGNTKIAGPASVDTSGNVVFNSSKFVGGYYNVPAGTSKTVIARATVSGNAPYGGDDDRFAFTFAAADVTAEDGTGATFVPTVTGNNLNGTTAPSVAITITGQGTITTAADTGKPLAKVLIAGLATEQEVHRIKLTATKEAFTVDKLAVGVSSANTTYDNVQYLRLYAADGVTALSEPASLDANGTTTFSGLSIQVPISGTTVIVKAMLNAIGERSTATDATAGIGSDTGDTLTFALSAVSGDFNAQGGSGYVDIVADAAVSNSYQVVKSAPTVSVLALPSTVLASDTVTIFKFSVTADANEDVTLARITPYITFGDSDGGNELRITAGTVKLYDMTAPSTVIGTSGVLTVSTTAAYPINLTSSTLPTIAKGTTKIFEVRADFTGVETSDSVSVKFVQDASALSGGVVRSGNNATVVDTINAFVWSDNGADTDAFTSVEWMNSFLLQNWDANSKTVSKS